MSRRTERIASLIRDTVGMLLLTKLSDPRIDPARTSITRVEVPADLLSAKVYISVMGSEGDQRNTLRALQGAAGHIQELMMREIELRNTPILSFALDVQYKKSLQTLALIQQASEELRRKEELRGGAATEQPGEEPAGSASAGQEPKE